MKGHSNNGLNLKQLHKNLGHFFVEWWCHQITIHLRPNVWSLRKLPSETSITLLEYEEPILVYCGNAHQAYQAEIKSLNPDVVFAQEAGIRVKILKTGRDSYG